MTETDVNVAEDKRWIPFDPAKDIPPQMDSTIVDVLFANGVSWQGFSARRAGDINWKGYGEGHEANVVAYRISDVPRWRLLIGRKEEIEKELRELSIWIETPNLPPQAANP